MSGATPDPDILAVILDEHRRLARLFLEHQEAVLVGDWEGATAKLADFKARLQRHLRVEEEAILPVYRERVGYVRGGTAEVFLLEHRRAERLLTEVESRFQRLAHAPTRRGTIALLDFEKMFKDYLAHHHLRERNLLYPRCRDILTAQEQQEVARLWELAQRS